jgi:hypothetical protein
VWTSLFFSGVTRTCMTCERVRCRGFLVFQKNEQLLANTSSCG